MYECADNKEFLTDIRLCVPLCATAWKTTNRVNEPALDKNVELLRKIGAGDRAAFAEFYDQHARLLFSIAFKILNDGREAEDVLQEVFLQIWNKAGNYNPTLGRPASWAITLTRNKAIDHIRSSQRRTRLMEQAGIENTVRTDASGTANESVRSRESAAMISSAVAGLPAEQRQAIELAFFRGLTQNQISETLKEPLGTIKARIRRGMLKLRDRLEGCV